MYFIIWLKTCCVIGSESDFKYYSGFFIWFMGLPTDEAFDVF
jgi:hypothetical protein